ncbi:TonB-dependent receptor [Panacibacter ginsenosidivorans]|uniref:TonB-dependent receptor n=1 Tax=Panacibacter ginsenosidivorans TaxID=1813871 RepID=A0A5B8VEC7_9BACT|nr:TonB-dependent receptor [Panacibacter ginsenosidivorans]QEC69780.1 TonB-dependent receptor [Panacibacter ginsenosidivorans]
MRKLILIPLCCIFFVSFAQNKDSTSVADSSLYELKDNALDNLPVISLDDNDFSDAGPQNVSSVLNAGRNPFFSAAAYNFSALRFKIRGYDADLSATFMNGIPITNLDNGFTPFGLWGGLNDVMRNRDMAIGLRPGTFAFGAPGTSTSIDARASKQRKQTSFSYAYSNRSYNHRWMLTHSTGINKKGWAFSFSGSRRWADEGYVPGTYYDGWSYFFAVDKRVGQRNMLSLAAFGAPTENGRQGAAVTEMQELAGTHFYNPYWGYQNGKKRNASVGKTNQPVFILTHEFRINDHTSLLTAAGYSFGKRSISGVDWYNAPDPRPDYYRYLPSFQTDPAIKDIVTGLLKNNEANRQINWQNFYDVNRDNNETIYNADGIAGNNVTGHRALYILSDRVTDTKKFNFNSTLNSSFSDHLDFTAGLTVQSQKNIYYQQIDDLLGGEFYVDLNQFAERSFPGNNNAAQNNLDHPNGLVKVGEKYGYNYDIDVIRTAAWAQTSFKYNKLDFFLAGEVSQNVFWRKGNVRNGLFPDDSYGKSDINYFVNFSFKGGFTYKLNGRNYLYVNAAYSTRAPFFENAYIAPRTRNIEQDDLTSEIIQTAEAGYILNAPKLKIRLNGYYTSFRHGFNVLTFYHETYQNFVNYALSNIDKLHFGGEFGFEAKVARNLTVNAAAAVGRYYYNSRQNAVVSLDNTAEILDKQTVYSENYRIAATPQEAYSLGFTYRSPKFWFLSLTGNYFDQMWLDFNPIRRTAAAVEGVDPKSTQWQEIIDQTRLKAAYTVDFFGGYSYKISRTTQKLKPMYLVFNVGINNLLNNKNIVTGGYEQLRFDFDTKDPNQFPAKLYYAYGLNYFASVTLRF